MTLFSIPSSSPASLSLKPSNPLVSPSGNEQFLHLKDVHCGLTLDLLILASSCNVGLSLVTTHTMFCNPYMNVSCMYTNM